MISGSGSYAAFVDYFASLYSDDPTANCFTTEADWQVAVTADGWCGKYVYDEDNNTLRIPKLGGILEGTITSSEIGNTVQAGLPTMTAQSAGTHTHTEETAGYHSHSTFGSSSEDDGGSYFTAGNTKDHSDLTTRSNGSHTHTINSAGAHTHSVTWGVPTDKPRPQTIQVYYYVVAATSTKTEIEIDIDEITADLNGKADIDLSNLDANGQALFDNKADIDFSNITSAAKILMSGMGMPSSTYEDLTLGSSGTTYTAPANGWFMLAKSATTTGQYMRLVTSSFIWTETGSTYNNQTLCVYVPVKKGDVVTATYSLGGSYNFKFIYAIGSESLST